MIAFAILFAALAIGIPVAFALMVAGITYAELGLDAPLYPALAAQKLEAALENFLLVAVPLFVFAGELMTVSGLTQRVVRLADYIIGGLRAGMAHVSIAVAMFVSGISGLGMADAAAVGSAMIPEMRRARYPAPLAAAIIATTGALGPIIPPSVTMVIYAVLAGASIGGLFLGGITVGLLLGVSFMLLASLLVRREARRGNVIGGRIVEDISLRGFFVTLRQSALALIAPVIILAGIFTGAFTATEAGAVACAYTAVLGAFVYRTLTPAKIWEAAQSTAILSAAIMFIFGVAAYLSWLLSFAQVPAEFADLLLGMGLGQTAFLLLLSFGLIALGTIMDPTAAMIIVVPTIVPAGLQLGADPLHLGMVIVLALSIGLITPPIGYVLYICSTIARTPIEAVAVAALPFIGVTVVVLVAVIVFPPIVTWLPHSLGFQ